MSDHDTGGPAFPSEQGHTNGTWNQTYDPGMTLEDWYAGQARWSHDLFLGLRRTEHQKMLADPRHEYQERCDLELEVEWRYDYAAAMIAEKRRREAK